MDSQRSQPTEVPAHLLKHVFDIRWIIWENSQERKKKEDCKDENEYMRFA
jgi:hypothetical protein